MRSIKIKISEKQYKRCLAFAEERAKDNDLYKRRGAFKIEDLIAGAMGEIGAWKYLKARGFSPLTKPDFTIHSIGKKSYDADIVADGDKKIHVKSQTKDSVKRYGESWLMQRHDPLFDGTTRYKHYMMPTVVDIGNRTVEIFGCISWKSIIENGHIGECKAPFLRNTKVAIYLDSLMELSYNGRWRFFSMYGNKRQLETARHGGKK